jgi:hypothetical protein
MATTTNYGWTTPDDTALVKDGASAIRTLGTSVDTTTKALNPSTTLGDVEYRSSTTNTNTRLGIGSSGQALTVVAGVPSWAASATSILTTTGDTLYASAANTLARRAIGSTGDVLTVSGGLPTWAAPASGSMTLLSTTTLSGTSTTVSSISGSYQHLMVIVNNPYVNSATNMRIYPNSTDNISAQTRLMNGAGSGVLFINTSTAVNLPTTSTPNNTFCLQIFNYSQTSNGKNFIFGGNAGADGTIFGGGAISTTSAISAIQFSTINGTSTFSGGTVLIYGVK